MAIKITDPKIRVTMINDKVRMYLLPPLFNAAVRAGASIMRVYKNLDDYDISLKDDKTPITLADRVAHKTIREYLGPTRIPILSEEGRKMRYEERRNWELYWLVDPLDGTVEFIKGNNEFTVNIALMENNVCMGAVIYVPYFEKMYVAGRGGGAFLKERIAPDAAAAFARRAIEADMRYMHETGVLDDDGLMGEGEYDEDDAFEALFAEMTDGLEDDGEIGRIAQMLDAYMEARQDFMEENGLADD